MSSIKNVPVSLSDIVEEADLILEVRCLESFTEEVAIRSPDSGEAVPSFKKKGFIFSVKGILKNKAKIDVPETIRVPKEEWRRSLGQHKEKYSNGPSKSYEVKQYKTGVASMKDADILFLHHFQGSFELETKDSFESAEAHEKISILIAAG